MKRPDRISFLFSIAFTVISISAFCQYLPVNSAGKCEVADIVLADSLRSAVLFSNEKKWFHTLVEDGTLTNIKHDSLEGRSSADVEMLLYGQTSVFKKISGSVHYHILVETKDGKYRYSFSDFVYDYYKQDRNYKIVKTGKTKPLEEVRASGWQKLWNQHRTTVYNTVLHQVETLKAKIKEVPVTKPTEKKVEW